MRIWILAALVLTLTACKTQPKAATSTAAAPVPEAVAPASAPPAATTTPTDAFEQASARYLIDTKAVKTDCAALLGEGVTAILDKSNTGRKVCGRMTLGLDGTRQILDIAHGQNQVSPWEDGAFTSGVFGIEDNVVMAVLLFPEEGAIVLAEQAK